MKLKAIVHEAEEGGFWAEVPAIPGCATQGETYEELMCNHKDRIVFAKRAHYSIMFVPGLHAFC